MGKLRKNSHKRSWATSAENMSDELTCTLWGAWGWAFEGGGGCSKNRRWIEQRSRPWSTHRTQGFKGSQYGDSVKCPGQKRRSPRLPCRNLTPSAIQRRHGVTSRAYRETSATWWSYSIVCMGARSDGFFLRLLLSSALPFVLFNPCRSVWAFSTSLVSRESLHWISSHVRGYWFAWLLNNPTRLAALVGADANLRHPIAFLIVRHVLSFCGPPIPPVLWVPRNHHVVVVVVVVVVVMEAREALLRSRPGGAVGEDLCRPISSPAYGLMSNAKWWLLAAGRACKTKRE